MRPREDRDLLAGLSAIARRCWRVLEMSGYARVDFRVDTSGKPLVLEVNPNPCVSPDAGLVAAASRAGWSYSDLVCRILRPALRRAAGDCVQSSRCRPAAVAAESRR